jgi:mannose/fructose/N-acetylgalactosamine-specific phosphotransferase system component IID
MSDQPTELPGEPPVEQAERPSEPPVDGAPPSVPDPRLDSGTLFAMGLRANLLQAAWNFERQQGIGWAHAMAPALRRLYPTRETRLERLAEHTAFFNTQPTFASIALGAAAKLEEQRATGSGGDAASMARLKAALGSTLAAIGDRLFWFTLRPFAAALGVLLAMMYPRHVAGALALWLVYAVPHLALRFRGVAWGYAQGPAGLSAALRGRLEGTMRWLAVLGCVLLGITLAWALAPAGEPRPIAVQCALAGGMGLGLLTAQRARPSPTRWALVLGILGLWLAWRNQG